MRRIVLLMVVTLGLVRTSCAGQDAPEFRNPVFAGDYPDPSVIRVGKEYWGTATSSEWGPPFPIFRSEDLVNWTVTGTVFQDRPEWAVANFWAPEIIAWKGRYYVYYVARKQGGPLAVAVASADSPGGPYTDHGPMIAQEAGSIDPVAVDDEHGVRHLIWKEDGNSRKLPTILWSARLSDDGTKLISEPKELIRNDARWEGAVVEGPFVVRRNGWFYLFYSGSGCCGAGCNYAMGVARSRSLHGPWEKHAKNPILAGNADWRCPGHGSIVDDEQGRSWLLYHSYSARDFIFTGRQALLDEVKWGADGWPVINDGKGPTSRAKGPTGRHERKRELMQDEDFKSAELAPGWNWPIARKPDARGERGHLVLTPPPEHVEDLLGGVLGRSITTGDFTAATAVDIRDLKPGVFAGMAAVGDVANATGIAVDHKTVIVWHRTKGAHLVIKEAEVPESSHVHLRMISRNGSNYRFAISGDGQRWTNLGADTTGKHLPPWDRAVRVALTVGGAQGAVGRFDYLKIAPDEP